MKLIDLFAEMDKKHLKVKDQIKKYMSEQFRPGDKNVELSGSVYKWTLTKSSKTSIDSKALKENEPDIYKKYSKASETLTLKNVALEK